LKLNTKFFRLLLPVIVGLFAVSLFVQSAKADEIDFQLAAQDAVGEGSIILTGSNFSTTGIDVTPNPVLMANLGGDVFDLTFNTATGLISINGATEGGGSADIFNGTISSFTTTTGGSTETINMIATWSALPADVLAFFGLPANTGGNDITSVGFLLSSCASVGDSIAESCIVNSVDVAIVPTPEPATLLLFGSGLLGLGALVRRKLKA
jgi:PEP-CTERM motif